MTEFNPLLRKTNPKIQISFTDSSEQEDDSSKPLLRKKVVSSDEQIRYRPKSLSMISRSQYSSAEFRNSSMSSMTMTQSMTSSKTSSKVTIRPTSFTETSSQKVYISETNAEKLFIKSLGVTSSQSQKLTKSSSSNSATVIRPISCSEPLYIQDIPSDPFPAKTPFRKEMKIEIKETTPSLIRSPSPTPAIPRLITSPPVEVDGSVMTKEESSEMESETSSASSESSSDSEPESIPTGSESIPTPLQKSPPERQESSDLLYSSIIPGQESTIEIKRGNQDLGFNIIGGADTLLNAVFVLTVLEKGAAAKDGRIWPGDQILSANGRNLRFAAHDEAIEVFRKSPAVLRLVVLRDEEKSKRFLKYQRKMKLPLLSYWDTINNENEADIYDLYEVQLKKKTNQSLGLCIIGRRNDPGVFVTEVTPGGVAERESTIRRGDQILAINDQDIKIAGQEVAAELVKKCQGNIHLRMGRLKSGVPNDLMDMPVVGGDQKSLDGGDVPNIVRERENKRFVEIEKPYNTPLGIYIAGGVGSPLGDVPVFVAMIEETNVIGGKLKIGDMIISVNGQTTERKTHDEVVDMMSTVDDMIILMQVQEPTEEINRLSSYLRQAVRKRTKKKGTLEMKEREAFQPPRNVVTMKQPEALVY